MTEFSTLGLVEPLTRALAYLEYTVATPIQAGAIPPQLEGKDVLGLAQTGTGKTASFALPLLQRLYNDPQPRVPGRPRVLILTPTRELAVQVSEGVRDYGRFMSDIRHGVVVGGVDIQRHQRMLKSGLDILVATPGRLQDLMNRRAVDLRAVEVFVLDEADRMLDMGFAPTVNKIAQSLPRKRQTVMFSATLPKEVTGMVSSLQVDPVRVEVARESTVANKVDQKILFVQQGDKRNLLLNLLGDPRDVTRAIVFTRTKHGANKLGQFLEKFGVGVDVIHGNKSQGARQRALNDFKSGRVRALVATDIAARGIDVDGVSHVINFDLPNEPESYVHRIGRTARAGASGVALSLCAEPELDYLRAIERTIQDTISVHTDHEYHAASLAEAHLARSAGRGGAPKRAAGGNQNGARKAPSRAPASRDDRHRDNRSEGVEELRGDGWAPISRSAPHRTGRPTEGHDARQGESRQDNGPAAPRKPRPKKPLGVQGNGAGRPQRAVGGNRPQGSDAPRRRSRDAA
ncbi:MAG: DEAD/DEAH box helicase [Rhodospirillum sp.]|nr:DEAD/DEAH box helicase [Rhodospirillum sp.]MCF8488150.1 DEAD/DEAH box helicase [Rhodospirillum sp.]MCF8502863.1 DEAD/DEAH box helicase [Rhodospirillum sp.]